MAANLITIGLGTVGLTCLVVALSIITARLRGLTPAPAPRIHARPTDAAPFGVAWTDDLAADALGWSASGCPMPGMPTEPVRVCADGHRALIPVRGVLPTRPRWVCKHGHPSIGRLEVETIAVLPEQPPTVTVTVVGGGR
jgi:hypothetical protein